MKFKKIAVYCLAAAMTGGLAGCSGTLTNEGAGAVTGGVIGGVIGSSLFRGDAAIGGLIVGSALGAMVGAGIGRQMDEQDRVYMRQAIIVNDIGEPRRWTNERTHITYIVTPVRHYYTHHRVCRTYTTQIWVDGRRRMAEGTACRMPNGEWEIKS